MKFSEQIVPGHKLRFLRTIMCDVCKDEELAVSVLNEEGMKIRCLGCLTLYKRNKRSGEWGIDPERERTKKDGQGQA